MTPVNPADEGATLQHTAVALKYGDASQVVATDASAKVALAGDRQRPPVRLDAAVKDPLALREALSALHAIVASDYRYVPKDRAAYAAYLRMKKETSHLGVWQAQQAFFAWLHRNDPLAALVLDPVITVHPDGLFLEVFSKDEGTYAQLHLDQASLDITGQPEFGTTSVDFSQALFDGVQLMRSYRATRLVLGEGEVRVAVADAPAVLEKQIRVPDAWLRGLLQVQSAATLPLDRFALAPMDLYNLLRHLRLHGDIKGKRRGLRIELVPGEKPRIVLEPWEKVLTTTGEIFKGKAARVVRVWGRRRLLLLRRLLPYVQSCDVHLLGSGLPSFWVFRGPGITLTLGMTGFTASNWSQAVNFDLLLPRKSQGSAPLEKILDHLGSGVWFAKAADIGKATGLKGPALVEALQLGCQQGQLMFDLSQGVYRLRPLLAGPIDLLRLQYRNVRERVAHDLMVRRDAVEIVSQNRIAGTGLELVGKVSVAEDRRDYRPQMLLGDEGQVAKAECTCSVFRKQGLKGGPCVHLIALRLAWAEQEAKKAKGVDPRQVLTLETRSYTRRDAKGEQTFQVTLDRQRLKVRWGRAGQEQRQQTLRYNSVEEARTAYFARVSELDERGYLSATGD